MNYYKIKTNLGYYKDDTSIEYPNAPYCQNTPSIVSICQNPAKLTKIIWTDEVDDAMKSAGILIANIVRGIMERADDGFENVTEIKLEVVE